MTQLNSGPVIDLPAKTPRETWMQEHRVCITDAHFLRRSKRGMRFHAARGAADCPACFIKPVGKGDTVEDALQSLAKKLKVYLPPK